MRYILMDVEGTTTSIHFVHRTLFPYSAAKLDAFLRDRRDDPAVLESLARVRETLRAERGIEADAAVCAQALKDWIAADRKHPALKNLQGLIWKDGYESGAIKGHVYPDVPGAFRRWRAAGLDLGIYSSGSVLAQKLIFGHSESGDLTPLLKDHFDTSVGNKRAPESYQAISRKLGLPPADVLFLSDVAEELAAAREAGFQTIQIVRAGTEPSPEFETAASFDAIAP